MIVGGFETVRSTDVVALAPAPENVTIQVYEPAMSPLRGTLAAAIEDEQLMPDQHGFGNNGAESTGLCQSGHGDDQMNK